MMASQFYRPKTDLNTQDTSGSLPALGVEPFNRDDIHRAFGPHAKGSKPSEPVDGQQLAGTGALVFEGELLELPRWH